MAKDDKQPRKYAVSTEFVSILMLIAGLGAAAIIVVLLVLISFGPEGRYEALDESQYQETVLKAAQALTGYEINEETGSASIPIERAMQIVAENGVSDLPFAQAATEPAETTGEAEETETAGGALPDGEAIFASCASCHQANGQGIPGAFPPLAGHAPELYAASREYLPTVLLYGLQGQIEVEGQTYNGVMPAWAQLSDAEIAAVLNYVLTAWENESLLENFEPYAASEVAALRGQDLSAAQVYEMRQGLELE